MDEKELHEERSIANGSPLIMMRAKTPDERQNGGSKCSDDSDRGIESGKTSVMMIRRRML